MTNFERLVEFLMAANDNNTKVVMDYTLNSGNVTFSAEIVPDIMVVDDWMDIYDKEMGSALHAAVKVESDVEYNEDDGEFYIEVEDGALVIAVP